MRCLERAEQALVLAMAEMKFPARFDPKGRASLLRLVTALAIDSSEPWSKQRYLVLPKPTPPREEGPRQRSA